MKFILFFLCALLMTNTALTSCKSFFNSPDSIHYSVQTIDEKPTKEFERDYDWPLEIIFEDYDSGEPILGSIKLAKLGWLPITQNCTEDNCFIVDTKGKLGPVEFISIKHQRITKKNISGMFYCAGPTIDTSGHEFTASAK
ncbi:MAG: hypothetical protein DWQ05_12740 [Calditrichaeota bacterium]|nr:MAG: hypothetical protein DWQ05_12740 [Calditrichota bacterium]